MVECGGELGDQRGAVKVQSVRVHRAEKFRDKTRRLPLADADMKAIKSNLARLDKTDQLLVRLLASTGMRLSEAFEIDGEEKERGVRYVVIAHKTAQSGRRVPLPAAVLPYVPKSINGPLFDRTKNKDPSDAAAGYGEGFPVTLLRKWIDRIGF